MAVTALKMVENGQIELEKPINNYLTSWKIAENDSTKKTPITLRMLLSHSAGTSQTSYFGFTPIQPSPTIIEILSGSKFQKQDPLWLIVNQIRNFVIQVAEV